MPDIILLDIYIPGINVWDFLDRIRWLYPTFPKPVEVYILSAVRYAADVERAKKYWFVKEFMLKPVTKEMIQQLIRKKEAFSNSISMLETAC
jgi:two-component SAPR family response regulator